MGQKKAIRSIESPIQELGRLNIPVMNSFSKFVTYFFIVFTKQKHQNPYKSTPVCLAGTDEARLYKHHRKSQRALFLLERSNFLRNFMILLLVNNSPI
jgi:hypothetical protein